MCDSLVGRQASLELIHKSLVLKPVIFYQHSHIFFPVIAVVLRNFPESPIPAGIHLPIATVGHDRIFHQ